MKEKIIDAYKYMKKVLFLDRFMFQQITNLDDCGSHKYQYPIKPPTY